MEDTSFTLLLMPFVHNSITKPSRGNGCYPVLHNRLWRGASNEVKCAPLPSTLVISRICKCLGIGTI